ncbi:MAG TPA: hypothetical protein VGO03_21350 [Acidimicrobiia bacterium]
MTPNVLAPEAPHHHDGPGTRRGHRVLAAIFIVLGTILTPLMAVALFVHTQLTDTDRYVQTVAPLSSNAAIQSFVANDISDRLISKIDEKRYIASLLPSRAQPLVAPMRSAFEGFVHSTALKIVQSDQFQKIWKQMNRTAHTQLQYVLTGKQSGVVKVTNGTVSIDTTALVNVVVERLKAAGIDVFSKTPIAFAATQIPMVQSDDLQKINGAMNVLDKLAFLLPFLVLVCFGGAILLSRDRRRGFLWSAIGFGAGALSLGLGLTIGRHFYLGAISSQNIPHEAAAAIYDTLVRFLRTAVRAALLLAVIVVVAVVFAGPSRVGTGFRNRVHAAVNWLGARNDAAGWSWLGPIGAIARHKGAWRAVIAVALFVVLFRWPHATPAVVFWIGVLAVLLLAVVEYFGREPSAAGA